MTYDIECKACGMAAAVTVNRDGTMTQAVEVVEFANTCAVVLGEVEGRLLDTTPFCSYLEQSIREATS